MKSFERMIMFVGLFLSLIPIVGLFFGFFNLIFSLVVLIVCLVLVFVFNYLDRSESKFSVWEGLALGVFGVVLVMFLLGSFSYPWLEDSDPYGYALVSDYIGESHTFMKPVEVSFSTYTEPDPVGYSIFMSVFDHGFDNINFTLKFMNALVVSLSVLFSFYFFRRFFKSDRVAFFGMFVLACIPSFQTHFIFATSLAVMMFFPAFYFIERTKEDRWFVIPAGLVIASILVTHHLAGFAFGIFFIIYLLFNRNWSVLFSGFIGLLLSLVYWGYALGKYGCVHGILSHMGVVGEGFGGTGDKLYTFMDFFWVTKSNLINVSYGWGLGITMLIVIVLFCLVVWFFARKQIKEKMRKDELISWCWFAIGLLGVLAVYLPFSLMAFRWWTFLAIGTAMLCSCLLEGIWRYKSSYGKYVCVALLVLVVLFSFVPKWQINTGEWMPSQSLTTGAMPGLLWAKDNIPGASVFSFSQIDKVNGFNLYQCRWCPEEFEFASSLNHSALDVFNALNGWGYDYLLMNVWDVNKFGNEEAMHFYSVVGSVPFFVPVYESSQNVIFRLEENI